MSTEFKREERYIVFKLSDVEEHFTPGEKQQLARLAEVQRVGRSEAGKPPLECVVVEADWPEYEPTWKAIEARMTGAPPAPSVPDGWKEGVESAARLIDQKAELYATRFGHDDLGGLSFGTGPHAEIKMDHYASLLELAEEARAILAAAAPNTNTQRRRK